MPKNHLLKTILLTFTFLLTSSAHALLLVEPFVGYRINSGDQDQSSGAKEFSYNGVALGARLGVTSLGFMGGVEYMMSPETDLETETRLGSVLDKDTDAYSRSDLGIFVGYELPILLRAWATYYLSSTLEDGDTGANQQTDSGAELKGNGYGLGVGFTGLPFLSVNLQYNMFTYDELNAANGTQITYPTSGGQGEFEFSEIMLSVSLPLDL